MSWSACVVETVTGKYIAPLDCNISSWGRELNGTDTATVTMSPGALTVANRDTIRNITTPWRMSLVIQWSFAGSAPIPIFAGPIVTRPWDGKQVQFNAVGIRTIFAHRKLLLSWIAPWQTQVQAYANESLGSIAVSLVRDVAMAGTKAGVSLPITFPSTETDSDATHVRTYNGYSLTTVDQAITDLTNVINGPDVDFLPGWTDATQTMLSWTMRVGTDEQPKIMQAGTQVMFDASAAQSAVKLITMTEDASLQTTTQWALGSGDGTGVLMSMAQSSALTGMGWPALESETDYQTVLDQPTLDAHTAGDLAAFANATSQFTLTIDCSQPPAFGSYLIGDPTFVRVANHPWIPDSTGSGYAMRIVKMSGDSSTSVDLDVQNA